MRKRRRRYTHRGERRPLLRGIAAMLCALLILFYADLRMRPVIESMAAYQANVYAAALINNAVLEQLQGEAVDYGDFITINLGQDGEISSIQTDMREINLLKARMARNIAGELEKKGNHSLYVPIGTLLGNQITSGRGPRVEIKVVPTGYVQSDITHQFTSAGVNQTLHQLMLEISVHMVAIVPGYTVRTETHTNVCVAEIIIVGKIPDSFAQIDLGGLPVFSEIREG